MSKPFKIVLILISTPAVLALFGLFLKSEHTFPVLWSLNPFISIPITVFVASLLFNNEWLKVMSLLFAQATILFLFLLITFGLGMGGGSDLEFLIVGIVAIVATVTISFAAYLLSHERMSWNRYKMFSIAFSVLFFAIMIILF